MYEVFDQDGLNSLKCCRIHRSVVYNNLLEFGTLLKQTKRRPEGDRPNPENIQVKRKRILYEDKSVEKSDRFIPEPVEARESITEAEIAKLQSKQAPTEPVAQPTEQVAQPTEQVAQPTEPTVQEAPAQKAEMPLSPLEATMRATELLGGAGPRWPKNPNVTDARKLEWARRKLKAQVDLDKFIKGKDK